MSLAACTGGREIKLVSVIGEIAVLLQGWEHPQCREDISNHTGLEDQVVINQYVNLGLGGQINRRLKQGRLDCSLQ